MKTISNLHFTSIIRLAFRRTVKALQIVSEHASNRFSTPSYFSLEVFLTELSRLLFVMKNWVKELPTSDVIRLWRGTRESKLRMFSDSKGTWQLELQSEFLTRVHHRVGENWFGDMHEKCDKLSFTTIDRQISHATWLVLLSREFHTKRQTADWSSGIISRMPSRSFHLIIRHSHQRHRFTFHNHLWLRVDLWIIANAPRWLSRRVYDSKLFNESLFKFIASQHRLSHQAGIN